MGTYADHLRELADKLDADFNRNVNEISKVLSGMGHALAVEYGQLRERHGWKALEPLARTSGD